MAWLCPGFWGSKRTDDEPKACFCLGWMVSLTLLRDFSCFKKTTKPSNKQSLPQCCTAPILPLSTRENRLPMQSARPCHQRIVPSTPLSTWLILSSSSAHRLVCLHSYLQPLHLRDCCHRHVLIPFQALLLCLFFNKPFSGTSPHAGLLYFTGFSSIGLSSSVFKDVSNCHCTYRGIDRYSVPLLPYQYFKMVIKKQKLVM